MTREEARSLLSRLSDQEVRTLLLQQLDKVAAQDAAAESPPQGFVDRFDVLLARAKDRLALMVAAIPRLDSIGSAFVERLISGKERSFVWTLLLFTAIVFAGGFAGEWLFRRLFTRIGDPPGANGAETVTDKLSMLSLRLVADLLAIGVFGLTATAIFFLLYEGREPTREAMAALFWSIIFIRLLATIGRFALAPKISWLRIPPLDDETARTVYQRFLFLSSSVVVAYFIGQVLAPIGLDEGLSLLYGTILAFIVLALFVLVIWRDRRAIAESILKESEATGQPVGDVRKQVAANWHIFATCLIVGLWIMSTLQRLITGESQGGAIIISLCVLVAIPAVDGILRAAVSALLRVSGPPPEAPPALHAATSADEGDVTAETHRAAGRALAAERHAYEARVQYRDVIVRNLRIVLAVIAVVILGNVWNIDYQTMAAKGVGTKIAGALFDIVITLILASAAWGIIKTAITQSLPQSGEQGEEAEAGEMGGAGGSRLQTLLPLLGKFLLITLIVMVAMVILSQLGVDIGPLLAGAGVVGLAVGFGAQTLVKDILSGVFFLLDDAFRVGEYIDVGDVRGTVEHISIRSLRLRHHRGPLNTIPFGEIRHLTNYSRDWAIMKLEVRVPFDTDLEKVRKLIKKVGQQLMDDPVHGPHFLQPLKSQGVNRMDDSAFIVRVKFMAKPGEQFTLRREVFRRIQESFVENGIQFAPRRVIVDTEGAASPTAAAAAAVAAAALSESGGDQGSGDDGPGS